MAQFQSLADLANLTQDELLPGLVNTLINQDQFSGVLFANAQLTDRPAVKGNRIVSEGTASYVGCDDTITPVALSASAFSYDLETIATSFDACIKGSSLFSSFTDVVSAELGAALSRIGKKVASDAISGSGSGGEIAGIETQIVNTVGQATAGAGNFSLSDLDAVMDLVRTSGPKVFVGAAATVNTIMAELRAANGATMTEVQGVGRAAVGFEGIPFLKSQYASAGELHLIDLNEFQLWVGTSEDNNIGGVFNMIQVGALENLLRKRFHIYTNVATVLKNTRAAASLTGVA